MAELEENVVTNTTAAAAEAAASTTSVTKSVKLPPPHPPPLPPSSEPATVSTNQENHHPIRDDDPDDVWLGGGGSGPGRLLSHEDILLARPAWGEHLPSPISNAMVATPLSTLPELWPPAANSLFRPLTARERGLQYHNKRVLLHLTSQDGGCGAGRPAAVGSPPPPTSTRAYSTAHTAAPLDLSRQDGASLPHDCWDDPVEVDNYLVRAFQKPAFWAPDNYHCRFQASLPTRDVPLLRPPTHVYTTTPSPTTATSTSSSSRLSNEAAEYLRGRTRVPYSSPGKGQVTPSGRQRHRRGRRVVLSPSGELKVCSRTEGMLISPWKPSSWAL